MVISSTESKIKNFSRNHGAGSVIWEGISSERFTELAYLDGR